MGGPAEICCCNSLLHYKITMASKVARFTLRCSSLRSVASISRSSVQRNTLRCLSSFHQQPKLENLTSKSGTQSYIQQRFYAAASKTDVESRVLAVCKAFDKITADKISLESHFINDLGLDSLGHVEVIMAVEDEFGFEIPDEHAEKLLTPGKIAQYVVESSQGGGVKPNLF